MNRSHHRMSQRGKMKKRNTNKWDPCYLTAILCRLLIILTSTSFIHPDEHFQNTHIAIEDVFKPSSPLDRTWEWDPSRLPNQWIGGGPVRSIVPVWVTSHLGLRLLRLATTCGLINPSTRALVVVPRLVLFFLSLLVDRLILKYFQLPELQWLYLSSLSSSLFICRTFSNSLESMLFTATFILSLWMVNSPKRRTKNEILSVIVWTVMNLFSVFVRVSYVCFGLPMVLMVFYTRLLRSLRLLIVAGSTAFFGALVLVYFDSLYFNRWPTIAPISLLLYNVNPQNLAQHGTHPYYLHLLVNGPILFGPALWFNGWWQIWRRLKSFPLLTNTVKLSMATVISGTLLLSLQPHQEPRFLLPLMLPLSVLSVQSKSNKQPKLKNSFWVVHLLHTVITVILFGYLHQGGLQLALEALPATTKMVLSYKTFDIPSSLLIVHPQITKVENLRGITEDELVKKLCETSVHWDTDTILIAPRWSITKKLQEDERMVFNLTSHFNLPHLDLDRLPLIYAAGFHRSSIGLYHIHHKKSVPCEKNVDTKVTTR